MSSRVACDALCSQCTDRTSYSSSFDMMDFPCDVLPAHLAIGFSSHAPEGWSVTTIARSDRAKPGKPEGCPCMDNAAFGAPAPRNPGGRPSIISIKMGRLARRWRALFALAWGSVPAIGILRFPGGTVFLGGTAFLVGAFGANVALDQGPRGCSSMVERQLPKLHTRVRFPSPAPGLRRVLASFWQEFARRFKEPPRGEGVIFNKRLIFGEP